MTDRAFRVRCPVPMDFALTAGRMQELKELADSSLERHMIRRVGAWDISYGFVSVLPDGSFWPHHIEGPMLDEPPQGGAMVVVQFQLDQDSIRVILLHDLPPIPGGWQCPDCDEPHELCPPQIDCDCCEAIDELFANRPSYLRALAVERELGAPA